jgi:predicted ribosome quality control (RQC) complex YloA/Tae2 family protein
MVYYFEIPEGNLIFMGKDKHENEKLIEYCWDEDVWFHVSDYSSAHVYVRL